MAASDEEKALFNQIHAAKAAMQQEKDAEKAAALRAQIGELTQKIRRLRMERGGE